MKPHEEVAKGVLQKIEDVILFPLISLMIAVAVLVFLWGVLQYILGADNDTARSDGRKHMMYGVIGFLVMVSAYAILNIAANTFGVTVPPVS